MQSDPHIDFVATNHHLREVSSALAHQPWIVLDTEFLRERTYFPQLCVIQVAAPGMLIGIDALTIDDWTPFATLLHNPAITKVFHAARQDVEALSLSLGALPNPIFDTQIAAALLHGVDQIGYAALVQKVLNVALAKTETRADWSRRPLLEKHWQYALDDVRYLAPVFRHQHQLLSENDRLHWLEEDFAVLSNPATYAPDFKQAWRRVRESGRLSSRELAVLQTLAAWREETAITRNLPRRWVLDDEVLLALAHEAPATLDALDKVRSIPADVRERYGDALLACVAETLARPAEEWPSTTTYVPLNPRQKQLASTLRDEVEKIAAREQLPATLLASRSTLENIARTGNAASHLRGWRAMLLSNALMRLVEK